MRCSQVIAGRPLLKLVAAFPVTEGSFPMSLTDAHIVLARLLLLFAWREARAGRCMIRFFRSRMDNIVGLLPTHGFKADSGGGLQV